MSAPCRVEFVAGYPYSSECQRLRVVSILGDVTDTHGCSAARGQARPALTRRGGVFALGENCHRGAARGPRIRHAPGAVQR